MEIAFYITAAITLYSAVRVVTDTQPVHALLYMVVSLLSIAMIFFIIGAPFAGALEVIVYAGAIMVLFVFVIMLLNLGPGTVKQERAWIEPRIWIGPAILAGGLLIVLSFALGHDNLHPISAVTIDAKQVGIALFGRYLLAVELASVLLLAALVAAWHLGRPTYKR
ncbi:hypothetical protein TI04_03790 [Achromatium sp. WMS2]|nr:hypothetical protein TI04_03790 [Achromatium sp. WMS2]